MRQQTAVEVTAPVIGSLTDPEPPDTSNFLRANPGAQQLLRELAETAGYEVSAPQTLEPASFSLSISQLLKVELDTLTRRERQLRELRALASCRVGDLKPEQVRRILEAIGDQACLPFTPSKSAGNST